PAVTIRAIRQRQGLVVLGDIARQGRGQVVAQGEPLLVVVLKREHALVRPVLVGQELAKRVGVFDRRRLHRLKAIALKHGADRLHHVTGGGDFGGAAIDEAPRQAGFELLRFFELLVHIWSTYQRRIVQ